MNEHKELIDFLHSNYYSDKDKEALKTSVMSDNSIFEKGLDLYRDKNYAESDPIEFKEKYFQKFGNPFEKKNLGGNDSEITSLSQDAHVAEAVSKINDTTFGSVEKNNNLLPIDEDLFETVKQESTFNPVVSLEENVEEWSISGEEDPSLSGRELRDKKGESKLEIEESVKGSGYEETLRFKDEEKSISDYYKNASSQEEWAKGDLIREFGQERYDTFLSEYESTTEENVGQFKARHKEIISHPSFGKILKANKAKANAIGQLESLPSKYPAHKYVIEKSKKNQAQVDQWKKDGDYGNLYMNWGSNFLIRTSASILSLPRTVADATGVDSGTAASLGSTSDMMKMATQVDVPMSSNTGRSLWENIAEFEDKKVVVGKTGKVEQVRDKEGYIVESDSEFNERFKKSGAKAKKRFSGSDNLLAMTGNTLADMGAMIATGKAYSSLLGAGAKAVKIGTALGITTQVQGDLYREAIENGYSSDQAGRFALIGASATGLLGATMGNLEANLVRGSASKAAQLTFEGAKNLVTKEGQSIFLKSVGKDILGELAEEELTGIGTNLLKTAFEYNNNPKFKKRFDWDDAVETAVLTPIVSMLPSMIGNRGKYTSEVKNALTLATNDPVRFGNLIDEMESQGVITAKEAAEHKQNINMLAAQMKTVDVPEEILPEVAAIQNEINEAQKIIKDPHVIPVVKAQKEAEIEELSKEQVRLMYPEVEMKIKEGKMESATDAVTDQLKLVSGENALVSGEKALPPGAPQLSEGQKAIGSDKETKPIKNELTEKEKLEKKLKSSKTTNKAASRMLDDVDASSTIHSYFAEGGKITPESYNRRGDATTRAQDGGDVNRRYMAGEDKGGRHIDDLAQELSEKHGIDEIEASEMINDYMNDGRTIREKTREKIMEQKFGHEQDDMFRGQEVDPETAKEIFEEVIPEVEKIIEETPPEKQVDFEEIIEKHYTNEDGEIDYDSLEADIFDVENEIGFGGPLLELELPSLQKLKKEYGKDSAKKEPKNEGNTGKIDSKKEVEKKESPEKVKVPSSNASMEAKVEIEGDTYVEWKKIDDQEKAIAKQIKESKLRNEKGKQSALKANAMEFAAKKRKVLGTQTYSEKSKSARHPKKVQKGDKVTIDGEEFTVTQPSVFGKIQVEDSNGKKTTHDKDSSLVSSLLEEKSRKLSDGESQMQGGTVGFVFDDMFGFQFKFPTKIIDFLKRFYKKTFTSKGLLNDEIFTRNIQRIGQINKVLREVNYTSNDLKEALLKHWGGDPDPLALSEMDRYLKSTPEDLIKNPLKYNFDPEITDVLDTMRSQISHLSLELVNSGLIDGPLAITFMDNLDSYVNRSYKVHDNKDWIGTVTGTRAWSVAKNYMTTKYQSQIKNQEAVMAKESAKKNPDKDKLISYNENLSILKEKLNDVDAQLTAMLREQQQSMTSDIIKQGKLGGKDLSNLKKRKDLPKEIRDLYGEYDDPLINYSKSIYKSVHLLENHKFLEDLRTMGEGKWLFKGHAKGEHTALLAAKGSSTFSPLNDSYVTPELKEAMESFGEKDHIFEPLSTVMYLASRAKYMKTIASPSSQARNFASNMFFHWANGVSGLSPSAWKFAINAVRAELGKNKTGREDFKRLIELGVVDESTTFKDMRELLDETTNRGYDPYVEKGGFFELLSKQKPKKAIKALGKYWENLYAAGDDLHKAVAFHSIRSNRAKAIYGKDFSKLDSDQKNELEQEVAQIVRNTMPTYSLVSPNVQKLRRIPLTGTFVSFPYESIRVTKNSLLQANKDIFSGNPKLKAQGFKRLLSLATVIGLQSTIATSLSSLLAGMGPEDDEKMKIALPPWAKHSNIIYLKKDDEKFSYIDLGSHIPQGYLMSIINSMLSGKETKEKISDTIITGFSPFLSWDMTVKSLLEIAFNDKGRGKPIKAVDDSIIEQYYSASDHLRKTIEPGFVTSGTRLYKSVFKPQLNEYSRLNPAYESMALLGIRVSNGNINTSFMFKSIEFGSRLQEARKAYRDVARDQYATPEDLENGKKKAKRRHNRLMKEVIKSYSDANSLLVSRKNKIDLINYLKENGFKKDISFIKKGTIPPLRIKDGKKTIVIK